MAKKTDQDIQDQLRTILNEAWNIRESDEVPSTDSVAHKNGAIKLDATFLYADLAGSTDLQKDYINTFAAKAIRMYLGGASTIIRDYGGAIKSFDGDRVMGVFTGGMMRNDAVKAAYAINWMIGSVMTKLVKERHEKNDTTPWVPRHAIGIDSGETFVARAGVRNKPNEHNHNDLVFIGRAPNVAAKLSALRESKNIFITHNVYSYLTAEQKNFVKSTGTIWSDSELMEIGPYSLSIYKTDYWRSPDTK